jgi:hypothetical protein
MAAIYNWCGSLAPNGDRHIGATRALLSELHADLSNALRLGWSGKLGSGRLIVQSEMFDA